MSNVCVRRFSMLHEGMFCIDKLTRCRRELWLEFIVLRGCSLFFTYILRLFGRTIYLFLLSIQEKRSTLGPDIEHDYPLNLSILVSGGKETNKDSLSSGERSGI